MSSFIFNDKNFINLIYKFAEDPQISEDYFNSIIENFKRIDISKTEKESKFFSKKLGYNSVSIPILSKGLDTLIAAVEDKEIKFLISDDKYSPVVQKGNALDQVSGNGNYHFTNYKDYYICIEALGDYIEELKTSPETQPLYFVMLGRIIASFNKKFGQFKTLKPPTIPKDENHLLSLAQEIKLNQPLTAGPIKLRAENISTKESFDTWYAAQKFKIFGYDGKIILQEPGTIVETARCGLLYRIQESLASLEKAKESGLVRKIITDSRCPPPPTRAPDPMPAGLSGTEKMEKAQSVTDITGSLNLSVQGALGQIVTILTGGGPFQKSYINFGSLERSTDNTFCSFINNCLAFFENFSTSNPTKFAQLGASKSLELARECKYFAPTIYAYFEKKSTLHSSDRVRNLEGPSKGKTHDASSHLEQIWMAKREAVQHFLQKLFDLVEEVTTCLGIDGGPIIITVQKFNCGLNQNIANLISLRHD